MKRKSSERFLICFMGVLLVLTFISMTAHAAVPQKINYQGYLTDSEGNPVNATVSMVFRIYNVPTSGTALWTETQSVTVNNGIYSVILGSVTLISLSFDVQYYLGVKVGTDAEMIPRQALTSVGYALRAEKANDSDTVDGSHASAFAASGHTHTESDPQVGTITSGKWCTSDGAMVNCTSNAPVLTETDPQVGTLTSAKWCTSEGTMVNCTTNAPVLTETDPTVNALGKASLTCSNGQVAKWNGSAWACSNDANSGGTVTQVNTGTGLTGGPITGTGTISLSSSYADGSVHDGRFVNVTGDTMTGTLNLPANGLIAGTNQLVLSGGNIGIGTTTPSAKLDVNGDINTDYDYKMGGKRVLGVGNNNIFLGISAGEATSLGQGETFLGSGAGFANTEGYANTFVGNEAGYKSTAGSYNTFVGSFAGYNNLGGWNTFLGSEAGYFNITGSGNVFIGRLAGYNETGSNKLYIDNYSTSTPLIYGDFSTDTLTVNGNVGLGTTTPDSLLTLYGANKVLNIQNTATPYGAGGVLRFGHDQGGNTLPVAEIRSYLTNGNGAGERAGDLSFFTSSIGSLTEKMRITGTGNVGIGTTTPTNAKLHVEGDSVSGVYGHNSTGGYGVYGKGGVTGVYGDGTSCDFNAVGPGVDYCASSSIRWKRNIQEIDYALDMVMNIRGVYFDWDEEHGGKHGMGFIAEEVGAYIPEIVSYEADGVYATGLDYSAITPVLVQAIKEQQKLVNKQQEQINELKAEIEELKKKF